MMITKPTSCEDLRSGDFIETQPKTHDHAGSVGFENPHSTDSQIPGSNRRDGHGN